MEIIFLGLGSNIGDKEKNLKAAIDLLSKKIDIKKVSRFYRSKPVGVEDQPEFINAVLYGYTDLSPFDLLSFTKEIEKQVGRIYRYRWGPREIDIDILFYGQKIIKKKDLTIPHPRICERDFVLIPLVEIYPEFIHPVYNRKLLELLDSLTQKSIIS